MVALADRLLVHRDMAGPRATGRVRVEILSSVSAALLTAARVSEDIAQGLAALDALLAEDRVAALAREHGLDCDCVEDYELGRAKLASVGEDGSIVWERGTEPRS